MKRRKKKMEERERKRKRKTFIRENSSEQNWPTYPKNPLLPLYP